MAWPSPTLPFVTVGFPRAAFSVKEKDQLALQMLISLSFGRTSPLFKRLVQDEQKVDQLFDFTPGRVDPTLATIGARQEGRRRHLCARPDPANRGPDAHGPGQRPAAGRRQVRHQVFADPHARQYRADRQHPGVLRALQPFLRHPEPVRA
ncbi:hypothetical protein LP419_40045 [Massilia sp. H-1]|nr:hypothetical protein LP419_40045 [Massilia sp. H-1]